MKRSKPARLIPLVLIFVLLLTACGSKDPTNTPVPAQNTPEATAQAEATATDAPASADATATDAPAATQEASTQTGDTVAVPPGDLIPIRTSSKLECTSTPFVVADKLGYFAEHGLVVEYTGELSGGAANVAALLNGTNDVMDIHPNSFATYVHEGAALKAVSLNIVDPPEDIPSEFRHMRLYAAKDNDQINSLADIANYKPGEKLKIVGTVPSCTTYILSNIFRNNGKCISKSGKHYS
jgi:predicted small lipoprotein YifL